MVTRLAGLLRHSLESSRAQVVPLRVELTAVEYYLQIEQVRHGDRLRVTMDVPEVLHERTVPSFLLQPLVENSIRHGFTDPQRPLHLVVRAREDREKLVLTVEDDGPGISDAKSLEGGIGLGNNRARLAALYRGRASLDIAMGAHGNGTRVTIVLPLDAAGDVPSP